MNAPMAMRTAAHPLTRLGRPLALCALLVLPGRAASPPQWYTYEQCTLIEQDFNDGDSFHVRAGRRPYIFRLYFVDAPETDDAFPDRVAEQATYWDIPPEEIPELGKAARRFTKAYLAKPFTVHTRRIDARGRSDLQRFFGMIETEEGYLCEALVRNGLARVYGMPTELPDGSDSSRHFGRLRLAEKAAKKEKKGCWARKTTVATGPLPVKEQDIMLRNQLPVFDPEQQTHLLGFLPRGAVVRILRAESDTLFRIRFKAGQTEREGVCRRDSIDLGPMAQQP